MSEVPVKERPTIRTAIPKRLYRLGEFDVTILDEIESGDGRDYRYVLAVIRKGESEPGMYLTCEPNPGGSGVEGRLAMRLVLGDGAQFVAGSDRWSDLDAFVREGLQMAQTVLDLTDEQPYRLR